MCWLAKALSFAASPSRSKPPGSSKSEPTPPVMSGRNKDPRLLRSAPRESDAPAPAPRRWHSACESLPCDCASVILQLPAAESARPPAERPESWHDYRSSIQDARTPGVLLVD